MNHKALEKISFTIFLAEKNSIFFWSQQIGRRDFGKRQSIIITLGFIGDKNGTIS